MIRDPPTVMYSTRNKPNPNFLWACKSINIFMRNNINMYFYSMYICIKILEMEFIWMEKNKYYTIKIHSIV